MNLGPEHGKNVQNSKNATLIYQSGHFQYVFQWASRIELAHEGSMAQKGKRLDPTFTE